MMQVVTVTRYLWLCVNGRMPWELLASPLLFLFYFSTFLFHVHENFYKKFVTITADANWWYSLVYVMFCGADIWKLM